MYGKRFSYTKVSNDSCDRNSAVHTHIVPVPSRSYFPREKLVRRVVRFASCITCALACAFKPSVSVRMSFHRFSFAMLSYLLLLSFS